MTELVAGRGADGDARPAASDRVVVRRRCRSRAVLSPPIEIPPPTLSVSVLSARWLKWPPSTAMPSPPESATSLLSMRLALAELQPDAVGSVAADGVARDHSVAGVAEEGDAVPVRDDGVVAHDVAVAVLVGVGQRDAGLLVTLHSEAGDQVERSTGVEQHAVGEPGDRAIGDRRRSRSRGSRSRRRGRVPSITWPSRSIVMPLAPTTNPWPGQSSRSFVRRTLTRTIWPQLTEAGTAGLATVQSNVSMPTLPSSVAWHEPRTCEHRHSARRMWSASCTRPAMPRRDGTRR